jgi:flagellar biogenesis protein FliO
MTPLRQRILAVATGLCLALCAFSAQAEEAPDASVKTPSWLAPHTEKPHAAAAGPSVGLGRSVGVLLLTSVLGGCALYLRSKKNKAPKAKLGSQLRVISAAKVGGRAQLVLAEVAGRRILLGVTDSTVNKLGWLEAEEEEPSQVSARPRTVAAGIDLAARTVRPVLDEPPAPAKRSFRDLLAAAVGNIGRPDDDSAALSIAVETRDTFTRSTPRTAEPRAAEPRVAEPRRTEQRKAGPQMLDVEGQARGLLARLGDPRA